MNSNAHVGVCSLSFRLAILYEHSSAHPWSWRHFRNKQISFNIPKLLSRWTEWLFCVSLLFNILEIMKFQRQLSLYDCPKRQSIIWEVLVAWKSDLLNPLQQSLLWNEISQTDFCLDSPCLKWLAKVAIMSSYSEEIAPEAYDKL